MMRALGTKPSAENPWSGRAIRAQRALQAQVSSRHRSGCAAAALTADRREPSCAWELGGAAPRQRCRRTRARNTDAATLTPRGRRAAGPGAPAAGQRPAASPLCVLARRNGCRRPPLRVQVAAQMVLSGVSGLRSRDSSSLSSSKVVETKGRRKKEKEEGKKKDRLKCRIYSNPNNNNIMRSPVNN